MNCPYANSLFSLYLDGDLTGAQMRKLSDHLKSCSECRSKYSSLREAQSLLGRLGRRSAPPDLALRLKVALSQERASSWQLRLQGFGVRFQNAVNAFMLPASGGLVTAVVIFAVLIGFLAVPSAVSASHDVPTSLYMPPRLASAPFAGGVGTLSAKSPVVIEADIDPNGRLEDYRIISGDDSQEVRKQLDRSLIFTVFEPAISFGRPASGRIVISFSNVDVQG